VASGPPFFGSAFSLGRFYSHKHKKKELSMNLKIIKTKEKYLIDRSFNKYDLKEYLSKLYGLKVQKITTRVLRNGLKKAVCLMVK
jgi:ribosomal protein L23